MRAERRSDNVAATAMSTQDDGHVVEELSVNLGTYLDVDTVLALSQVNHTLHERIWNNETFWKRLIQQQGLLFPEQLAQLDTARYADPVTIDGASSPSCSWRYMALTMNNVRLGRYRIVDFNPANGREDYSSDYWYTPSMQEEEDEDDDDDVFLEGLEEDSMSVTNEEQPPLQSSSIVIDGGVTVPRFSTLAAEIRELSYYAEPHLWWADALYSHYRSNHTTAASVPNAFLPPWSHDFGSAQREDRDPDVGTARSHSYRATEDGLAVYASETNRAVVVDLCSGDQIIQRLEHLGSQNMVVGRDLFVSACYGQGTTVVARLVYNLRGSNVTTVDLEDSWDALYGDYGWVNYGNGAGKLVLLDRVNGTVQTVYASERIQYHMACTTEHGLGSVHDGPHRPRLEPKHCDTPEEVERMVLVFANEEVGPPLDVCEMKVLGKLLILQVIYRSEDGACNAIMVVDMQQDRVLYGIPTKELLSTSSQRMERGVFRGGVVSIGTNQHAGYPVNRRQLSVLFAPTFFTERGPTLDETHGRLLDIFDVYGSYTGNPFHRHPNTRIPLHEMVGRAAEQPCLCQSTEQNFLFRLLFSALESCFPNIPDVPAMLPPLKFWNPSGNQIGESLWSWEALIRPSSDIQGLLTLLGSYVPLTSRYAEPQQPPV